MPHMQKIPCKKLTRSCPCQTSSRWPARQSFHS
jgi:hypothetical protein